MSGHKNFEKLGRITARRLGGEIDPETGDLYRDADGKPVWNRKPKETPVYTDQEGELVIEPYSGVNHRANIIMCCLTLGAWLPIYGLMWLIHGSRKRRVVVRH